MADCKIVLQDDDDSPSINLWGYGVGLALLGCVLSVVGLNLQRYSQKVNSAKPLNAQVSALRQPLNILGVACLAMTSVVDLAAFGFAPQSLLAPIGAVTLILNLVAAPLILKERLGKKDMLATLLVFFGVTTCIAFANHSTVVYKYDDLLCLFLRPQFQVYVVMMVLVIAVLLSAVAWLESANDDVRKDFHRLHRALYPTLGGIFGGGSVLFGKAVVELIKTSILSTSAFSKAGTYGTIIALCACLILQLRFLNRGLFLFESLFVVPVYQVFWVLVGILGGSVYFDELKTFTAVQWVMYLIGVAATLCGVLVLSTRKATPTVHFHNVVDEDDDDDMPELHANADDTYSARASLMTRNRTGSMSR